MAVYGPHPKSDLPKAKTLPEYDVEQIPYPKSGRKLPSDLPVGGSKSILETAGAALFLSQYIMEAVGFTEFIYEEAVQEGLRVLKSMVKKKNRTDLNYMMDKFLDNIFTPAYQFHKTYGPLNPYTYPGFDVFFIQAWNTTRSIPLPRS